jgi:hypothetical protein
MNIDQTTIWSTIGGAVAGAVLTLFGIKRQIKAEIRASLRAEIAGIIQRQDNLQAQVQALQGAGYVTEKEHEKTWMLNQRVIEQRFTNTANQIQAIHQLLAGQKDMLERLDTKIERLLDRPMGRQ